MDDRSMHGVWNELREIKAQLITNARNFEVYAAVSEPRFKRLEEDSTSMRQRLENGIRTQVQDNTTNIHLLIKENEGRKAFRVKIASGVILSLAAAIIAMLFSFLHSKPSGEEMKHVLERLERIERARQVPQGVPGWPPQP